MIEYVVISMNEKMKKFILFLFLCISFTVFADDKITYNNGDVTAYYSGNKVEIIDNNTNTCIYVTVDESRNSLGETVYDLACNNRVTKGLTKVALQMAIASAITAASSGTATPAVKVASSYIANDLYDRVCDYFSSNR